jgi:hypothetical protein
MKVYIFYEDTDNSCCDPDCCGGPSPNPCIKIFSSLKIAAEAGYKEKDLLVFVVDSNESQSLIW